MLYLPSHVTCNQLKSAKDLIEHQMPPKKKAKKKKATGGSSKGKGKGNSAAGGPDEWKPSVLYCFAFNK